MGYVAWFGAHAGIAGCGVDAPLLLEWGCQAVWHMEAVVIVAAPRDSFNHKVSMYHTCSPQLLQ